MQKKKIVFCGTPDFSVPTLELLYNHPSIEIVGVVSMPDRPAGRGQKLQSPPVAEFAKANKLPLLQTTNINKEEKFLNEMRAAKVDAIVVLAFAQFLGKKILELPADGCFNIHTSLLPKYRGAAPIQHAILNGDKTTGVSIQKMVKKMDAGDIVHCHEIEIGDNETGGQLYTRLKFLAALSINYLINKLLADQLTYSAQDESKVTFAPTLQKNDGLLSFQEKTVQQTINQIRALQPWPGTYFFYNEKRIKVFHAEPINIELNPGEVSTKHNSLLVGCSDGTVHITKVQMEGKKPCSDLEFLNGLKNLKK